MELHSRIKAWLRAKGMTQKALAAAVGVSQGAVSGWVKGDFPPTQKNLDAIVDALGITMAEFYGDVPPPKDAKADEAA